MEVAGQCTRKFRQHSDDSVKATDQCNTAENQLEKSDSGVTAEVEIMIMFTDTNSLMYEMQTEDFNADIAPDVDRWFDTSEYPGLPLKAGINKKVIGMFKDEACGKQMRNL